jgi:SAM-dependent methyltransferase
MTAFQPEEVQRLHQRNRAAWDEAAARYESEIERDVAFLAAGGKAFHGPEWAFLADLAGSCQRAIHLQCAGGLDTLSLWKHGAAEVVGIDISERMIACAQQKAQLLSAPASWYCCDVLESPQELNGIADLVYTGKGALLWIMDIDRWAQVVARLLKPRGRLYLYEGHPLTWVWDMSAAEYRLDPHYGDYFSMAVAEEQGWPTQYIPEAFLPSKEEQARSYERQWTLGQVVTAVADAGLRIVRLEEHPDPYWNQFPMLTEDLVRRLPQTFSLLARKD